jgi:hypothetical protein
MPSGNNSDLSLSKIEKELELDEDDIEDPAVMSDLSVENPLRKQRTLPPVVH